MADDNTQGNAGNDANDTVQLTPKPDDDTTTNDDDPGQTQTLERELTKREYCGLCSTHCCLCFGMIVNVVDVITGMFDKILCVIVLLYCIIYMYTCIFRFNIGYSIYKVLGIWGNINYC